MINDLSFDFDNRRVKGGLNADTDENSTPPSLCAEALPNFLTELVSLRAANPNLRIFMATTDVNDAYRNVRVDPDQAHNFCYVVDDIVIDFRLMFRVDRFAWKFRSDGIRGCSLPQQHKPPQRPSVARRDKDDGAR